VNCARTALSAIALLVAITGTATVPAFAGLIHPVCAAKQHDCGTTPKVSKCCCGDEQSSENGGTPAQSRIEVRAPLQSTLAVTSAVLVATPPAVRTVHSSSPHRSPVDLPTLFSSLLI
jgi:hypothetical protein